MKYLRIVIIMATIGSMALISYQAYLYFGRGTLSVIVKPNDANILVDNKVYSAKAALDIPLSPGTHKVVMALDGYNTIDQEIVMGWQDSQQLSYKLTLKSFKDIFKKVSPDVTDTNYEVAQPKFFLNETWAAGYLIHDEEGDVVVAVMQRINGAWKLRVYDNEITEDTKTIVPPVVYDYIKDFKE